MSKSFTCPFERELRGRKVEVAARNSKVSVAHRSRCSFKRYIDLVTDATVYALSRLSNGAGDSEAAENAREKEANKLQGCAGPRNCLGSRQPRRRTPQLTKTRVFPLPSLSLSKPPLSLYLSLSLQTHTHTLAAKIATPAVGQELPKRLPCSWL